MHYRLSKRQVKEIGNGKRLRIALPAPTVGFGDPLKWATGCLTLPTGVRITSAEHRLIGVSPTRRPAGSLGVLLGDIRHDDPDGWEIAIDVVLVDLHSGTRKPRGRFPTQWPACVILDDGTRLPRLPRQVTEEPEI